jgi:hypothetical protein
MTRIRFIGLALTAIFALGAVGAASASAFTKFESTTYPVKVKAEQSVENVFQVGTLPAGKVSCTKATFVSTTNPAGPVEVITVHPEYSGCTVFGVVGGTVTTTGCNYEVFANGKVNVKCELGKSIKVVAGVCEVTVGQQGPLELLTYANLATVPTTVEIKDNVAKIAYNSNLAGVCPANGQEATYKGAEVAKGVNPANEAEQYGIKVS